MFPVLLTISFRIFAMALSLHWARRVYLRGRREISKLELMVATAWLERLVQEKEVMEMTCLRNSLSHQMEMDRIKKGEPETGKNHSQTTTEKEEGKGKKVTHCTSLPLPLLPNDGPSTHHSISKMEPLCGDTVVSLDLLEQ